MQARGWRGLLAGVMIGSVAAAGGCGSGGSDHIEISKERREMKIANRKEMREQKKQEMAEKAKNQPRRKMRGGP